MSVMLMDPERLPRLSGAKAGVIVQVAFGAKVAGQVFVELNPAPDAVMLEMFSVDVPLLVRVTTVQVVFCPTTTLPQATEEVVSETAGAVPVPVKATE